MPGTRRGRRGRCRGHTHATGLVFVGPLFALVAPEAVFAGAGIALLLTGLAGATYAVRVTRKR